MSQRDLEPGTFIQRLPKTETHLHIEGALPWHLLHRLLPARFARPPESWRQGYRFRDFAHFESELLNLAMSWFTSPERYQEAARIVFARQQAQNVRYVETSFASGVVEYGGVNGREILAALKSAVPAGLTVKFFLGIHHHGYHERTKEFLDDCLTWPELDGIDLHGPEDLPLEKWTFDFWPKARWHGKLTKAHAGEFCGPDFIRRVIHELGVTRIEHGIRAAEDPDLLAEMADLGVSCDVCPLSNAKLAPTVPSLAHHPLRTMMAAGVLCTVSTDDPVSFGNTLNEEYLALHTEAGFSYRELVEVAKNGLRMAHLHKYDKQPLLTNLEALQAAL